MARSLTTWRARLLSLSGAAATAVLFAGSGVGLGHGSALQSRANDREAQPVREIDRTFRCTPLALDTGLRVIDVDAVPIGAIERYNPFQHPSPGFIGVASGNWEPRSELVSVRARSWQRFLETHSAQGVYASSRSCVVSRISVPLSASGLAGPPIRWAKRTKCLVHESALVRVHAVLQSPASWQRAGASYVGARRNVVEAALAVRGARTGKPIAYVELDRSRKTRVWLSSVCR